MLIYTTKKDEKVEKITEEVADIREQFNVKENDDQLLSQLTYLKWLNGAFKFKLNSFYSCEIEKVKLTNKVKTKIICDIDDYKFTFFFY